MLTPKEKTMKTELHELNILMIYPEELKEKKEEMKKLISSRDFSINFHFQESGDKLHIEKIKKSHIIALVSLHQDGENIYNNIRRIDEDLTGKIAHFDLLSKPMELPRM